MATRRSPSDQSIERQLAIDECCTEYDRALQADPTASLEDFAARGPAGGTPELLAELLRVDIDLRLGRGEAIDASDYLVKYPGAERTIRAAFHRTRARVARRESRVPPASTPELQLSGFLIERELGRGGMGVVYLARQPMLNRVIALKTLRSADSMSPEQRARFELEGELLARLQHPNIVRVFEFGERDGRQYLAMEFVGGGSLSERLRAAAIPPTAAADLAIVLARAVEYAHRTGVIHRDLKPSNVLFADDDTPKIADFGLALTDAPDQRLTASGVIAGTPSYMAPEQAAGQRQLGPAVDIYSLGAVMYEMLCGRPPFLGSNAFETSRQVMHDEPTSPGLVRPGVPADLATITLKCLEKDPARRYATAGELADDLERWRRFEPIHARPVSRFERAIKWCRRQPVAATATGLIVLALGIATTAAVLLRQQRNDLEYERGQRQIAEERRIRERVESLYVAAPNRVPGLLDELAENREQVEPLLLEAARSADKLKRLRANVGLAILAGDGFELPADLWDVPSAEAANLGRIMRGAGPNTRARLREQARSPGPPQAKAAVLLMHAGEFDPAELMLRSVSDPTPRTRLIDEFTAWHGDLIPVADRLRQVAAPARSGYLVAMGRIDPATLPGAERDAIARVAQQLFADDPDAGVHSAAGWLLQQWGVPTPTLPPIAGPGRGWSINRLGMTMITVRPGAYLKSNGAVVILSEPYQLCDREVSVELFARFQGRPPGGDARPVVGVNRRDLLRFCNWLSVEEGLKPCYSEAGDWDTTADGYRLPTEGEWEYALRAGSTTRYFFADDPRWLPMFAHIAASGPARSGSKMPNRWGLFDMVANAWEQVWDGEGPEPVGLLVNPRGPGPRHRHVTRGGAFDSGSYDTWSGARHSVGLEGSHTGSFRVARGQPGPDELTLGELIKLTSELPAKGSTTLAWSRAEMLMKARHWAEAGRAFEQFMDMVTNRSVADWAGFHACSLYLLAGEAESFERVRRRMLGGHELPESPVAAETLAKPCLLAAVPAEWRDRLDRLSARGLTVEPDHAHRAFAQMTRATYCYRIEKWAECLQLLDAAERTDRLNPPSKVLLRLCEAMARARLGQRDRARDVLADAETILAPIEAAWSRGIVPNEPHDYLLVLVWAAEARSLIRP